MKTKRIWNVFKVGDIVKYPDVWGDRLFQIYKLTGNAYLPELNVLEYHLPCRNSNRCIFNANNVKLYDAPQRPFRKLSRCNLIKIMNNGNIEAKREFLIRVQNCKI